MRALYWLVLAATLPAAAAPKPGFDCAKAATPVEKLICSDDGLASADAALSTAYGQVTAAHADLRDPLRDSQRAWMAERKNCIYGKREAQLSCMKDRYSDRLAKLKSTTLIACTQPVAKGPTTVTNCFAPNSPSKLTTTLTAKGEDLIKLAITANGKTAEFKLQDANLPDASLFANALELMDVNFDGFDDVKLSVSTSAGPNMGYEYYLYSPKSGRYEHSGIGEKLSGFEVTPDPKAKTISVNARGSCCDWVISTYAWKGGQLQLLTESDTGQFSISEITGSDQEMCGVQTRKYDSSGTIARIDFELGYDGDSDCDKDVVKKQANLADKLKAKAKGYRVEVKDKTHFAVVYGKAK